MAFGQASGPPATRRQIETLTQLVQAAGHSDFRDARGPLGLNQRQAGGRFTRDEAEELITQLETAAHTAETETPPRARQTRTVRTTPVRTGQPVTILRDVESELLAAELQRRGWVVLEP